MRPLKTYLAVFINSGISDTKKNPYQTPFMSIDTHGNQTSLKIQESVEN